MTIESCFRSNLAIGCVLAWTLIRQARSPDTSGKLIAEGSAQIGGQADPPGTLYAWTKVSGPGVVSFSDPEARETGVVFGATGRYRLRFTASHAGVAGSTEFDIDVGTSGGGGGDRGGTT